MLKDDWKLEGEYRITKVKSKNEPTYIVYSQVLTKEEEKKAVGFNVHLLEEEVKKTEKIVKKK